MPPHSSGISVVIPAYNEERFLPATLASVNEARRTFTSSTGLPAEVVVVNNASTDKTEDVASAHDAVVVRHEIRNIASVRNAGLRAASFSIIVTIDADCSIPHDSLVRIWEFMQDERYVGAALGVRLLTDKMLTKILASMIQKIALLTSGIYGAMFVFRKDAALEIGGFPEHRLIAEDAAFAIGMQSYGKKHGKSFGKLKAVEVGTLDRKELGLRALFPAVVQVIKAVAGVKQTPKDLKYWYEPDR